MKIRTKHNESFILRQIREPDYPMLQQYFLGLSRKTTGRFGPHGFDMPSIRQAYKDFFPLWGFITFDEAEREVVAYTLVKLGLIPYERERLLQYPGNWSDHRVATYAPSVADRWQGHGLAAAALDQIKPQLRIRGIQAIVLWGGVIADNQQAIRFYTQQGFQTLGQFQHNGTNVDMVLEI